MAKQLYGIAPTNVILRLKLMDSSSTTGAGLVGLTSASSGLTISTIQNVQGANGEATPVTYTSSGSTIEGIVTVGTYASPTATKCRFKELDANNHKGVYELQLADARFANSTNPLSLLISVGDATNLAQADFEIECKNVNTNITQIGGSTIAATNLSANFAQTASPTQVPTFGTYLADCIDYQRGHHTQAGKTYYVDGVSGSDSIGTGSRSSPYKTISKSLTSVVSSQHDQIILLPNSNGNPTTITESGTINIGQNYVQIRGPGRDVRVTNTSNTDIFSISANGVGLGGFRIATAGGSSNGITVTSGDFNRFDKVWIENAHQDAINLTLANRTEIENCQIISAARDGIRINDGGNIGYFSKIIDNSIRNNIGIGINLVGAGSSYARIQKNTIRDNATGIYVGSGVLNTVISDNRIAGNTTALTNNGTSTYEQWDWLNTDQNGSVVINSTSVGAAINQTASTWTNLSSPIATTETGGVSNTAARDSTYDVLTNTSQACDSYYEFSIGGTGVPTAVSIYAAVQNGTKTASVYGYNWGTTSWVQIGTMTPGNNSLVLVQYNFAMYTNMVGIGVNAGKVRIRFLGSATSTTISVDQLYVSYTATTQSVGYLEGAIWIDTINGSAGTTLRVNGTADNPVNNWVDALTLATALNVKRFRMVAGSTITLTENSSYYTLIGDSDWNLSLGGQNISYCYIHGANISGTATATASPQFEDCDFVGASTLPPAEFKNCGFYAATYTLTSGSYVIINGYDETPNSGSYPIFVHAPNTLTGFRNWHGAIQYSNISATNYSVIDGSGRLYIDSTCTSGQIVVNGFFRSISGGTNYVAAGGTLQQSARYATDQLMGGLTSAVDANVIKVNNDSTAASNMALQFNGTGIIGSGFPARQDQLSTIVATGAATNVAGSSWTNLSSPNATLESSGVAVTAPRDGIYDTITNTSQAGDSYYEFNIGGRGVPTGFSIYASVRNNSKTVLVYGYNWIGSSWIQIGTMNGTTSQLFSQYTFGMYSSMVGTGANLGLVRIRLLHSAASITTDIDQMYVSYTTVNNSIGYLDGAVWIDTVAGVSGTTLFINGTADKPVNTLSDAIILANALGTHRFNMAPNSNITLSQNFDSYIFAGKGIINLNNQSINECIFIDSQFVYGTSSGSQIDFHECRIGNMTVGSSHFHECQLSGSITTISSGTYTFMNCVDELPGGLDAPTINILSNTTAGFRNYRGGLQVNNMTSGSELKIDGAGRLVILSGCVGGAITIRGFFNYTDNVSGGYKGTLTQTARIASDQVFAGITGNISGSVNNVISGVTVSTNLDKTNYTVSSGNITNVIGNVSGSVGSVVNSTVYSVGSLLNTQQIRDSLTLSATSASITGSIDNYLTSIKISTSALNYTGTYVNAQTQNNVTVGTNLDKSNYTVSSGNITTVTGNVSGSVNSVVNVVSGGTSLTQQQIRDAMTLSTISASTSGSIDNYLTSIKASTSALNYTGTYVNAQIKAQDNIDFGALQKTSLNAATPISVGNVTGNISGSVANVRGNISGSVNSIVSNVTVGTNLDKTNYTVSAGTINTVTGNVSGSVNSVVNAVSGGTSLTQQQIRDAMTLSATSGSSIGSVDNYLTSIKTSTSGLNYTGTYVNAQTLNNVTVGVNLDKINYTVSSGNVTNVTGNVSGSVGSVITLSGITTVMTLDDNITNRNIIAESLKSQNVSTISATGGSIYSDIISSVSNTGYGKNLISFTTIDENSLPVSDVIVTIYDNSNQIIRTGRTDDNGLISGSHRMLLDDGIYNGSFSKSFYTYDIQSLLVSGDSSFIISGTRTSPTSGAIGTQTLYGFVIHGDASIAASAQIVATLESVGLAENNYQITTRQIITTSDSSGFFQIHLVKGATFKIAETWGGRSYYVKTITISSDETRDITTY